MCILHALQAILIGSAVKVAIKDGDKIDSYVTIVRDFGSLSQALPYAEQHDRTGSLRAVPCSIHITS
jgi:hypothetical protein